MAHHTIQPVPVTPRQTLALCAALVALALASSWIGIRNSFTYDDVFIVENNKLIQSLGNWYRLFGQPYWPVAWGADGYRPFTMLAFMLEWAAGNGKPWAFHAANIALYSGISVAVFFLARTFLPVGAAWIAAALFAVHPIHTEAVANIVGQAELWVAIFLLPAVTIYVRSRNANDFPPWRMAVILVLYALACLSKEHGAVLPFVLLAAELTIVRDPAPIRERFVRLRPFVLCLTAVGLAYIGAHRSVSNVVSTGFHEYVPFSSNQLGTVGRWYTMFGLAPDWVRLLLWPQRLSSEYGPPEYPVVTSFDWYQLPGILIFTALIALVVAGRRRSPATSFAVAFALIALLPTSNLIVPTGILLAERTLFLPSVGAMLAVATAVPWIYSRLRRPALHAAALGAVAVLILLGGWKSHNRTQVWKNNETLFTTALADAPYVYRTHFMMGAWRFGQKQKVEGERHYRVALTMYDRDPYVYFSLGQEYLMARMYTAAIPYFRRTLEVDSSIIEARARLAVALAEEGEWKEAEEQALLAIEQGTRSGVAMRHVLNLARKRQAGANSTSAGGSPAVRDTTGGPGGL